MKRSEMLKLISEEIYDMLHDVSVVKINTCKYTAEHILDIIEEKGMLPPEVNPIPQHIIDNCESANYWENE